MVWSGLVGGCILQLLATAAMGATDVPSQPAAALRDGNNALAPYTFVLEDDTGKLTIDQVRSADELRYRPLARGGENAGHARATYWLRFRVNNTSHSSSFILELSATPELARLHDDIRLVGTSGTSLPFSERAVAHANIAFRITLSPYEEKTFWLQQRSSDTVTLDVRLWTEPAFWEARSGGRLLNGIYYGVLFGLAAYNLFLFLFVSRRDRNYLLYVLSQVTTGLAMAALDRYTFQYLWPGHPGWAMRSVPALEFLSIAAGLAFARAFLDTRRLSWRLDAAMRVLSIAGLVLAAAWAIADPRAMEALGGSDFLDVAIRITAVLGCVHFLASIAFVTAAAAVATVRTGSTNARVFLVAWLVLLAGTAMAALQALGLLASLDGFVLMKLGSGLEAVLLSLALASRINALTRDRERAQREALDAHTRLLAANTARSEALRRLVSGVAHEVGNPLNFARGGAEELAAQLDAMERGVPGADSFARRAQKLVASGLARIKLILDNLRAYLSVGDADAVPTDLAHEIDQALELTGERLTAAGVQLEKQIGPLPRVQARPGQLHQVMLNLIANAVEAMPGGGTLRVVARAGEREVEVAMTDTGSGVEVADREKVFEPFFTTRAETGGTGLGLAVAREIVMKHGGAVRIEDGDGGGARVVVSLPRSQPSGAP